MLQMAGAAVWIPVEPWVLHLILLQGPSPALILQHVTALTPLPSPFPVLEACFPQTSSTPPHVSAQLLPI